jgi:hypothetical protein
MGFDVCADDCVSVEKALVELVLAEPDEAGPDCEPHNATGFAFAADVVDGLNEFTKSQVFFSGMVCHGLNIGLGAVRAPWGVHPISGPGEFSAAKTLRYLGAGFACGIEK